MLEVSKMYKLHLNAPGGVEKLTALHLAAQSNSYEILQSILEEKPDLFVESATEQRPSSTVTKNLLLVKLLKKEEVISNKTTLIFKIFPVLSLSVIIIASLLVPIINHKSILYNK